MEAPNEERLRETLRKIEELSSALALHLSEITDRIIREEVHASTQDAEEVREMPQLR